jgi:hypothetical protein
MRVIADNLWVCVDCIQFIANGELPDDSKRSTAIIAGHERELPAIWVNGGSELPTDQREFSWRPCACCGSKLGGDRYPAALIGV